MMAATGITTHKSTRAAYAYLREQGYDFVRKFWASSGSSTTAAHG